MNYTLLYFTESRCTSMLYLAEWTILYFTEWTILYLAEWTILYLAEWTILYLTECTILYLTECTSQHNTIAYKSQTTDSSSCLVCDVSLENMGATMDLYISLYLVRYFIFPWSLIFVHSLMLSTHPHPRGLTEVELPRHKHVDTAWFAMKHQSLLATASLKKAITKNALTSLIFVGFGWFFRSPSFLRRRVRAWSRILVIIGVRLIIIIGFVFVINDIGSIIIIIIFVVIIIILKRVS